MIYTTTTCSAAQTHFCKLFWRYQILFNTYNISQCCKKEYAAQSLSSGAKLQKIQYRIHIHGEKALLLALVCKGKKDEMITKREGQKKEDTKRKEKDKRQTAKEK